MDDVAISGVVAISVAAVILQSGLLDSMKQNSAQHDSILTGQLYLQELLGTVNEARFRNVTRMDRATFDALLTLLERKGNFTNSKYLSTGEKLLPCTRWQFDLRNMRKMAAFRINYFSLSS